MGGARATVAEVLAETPASATGGRIVFDVMTETCLDPAAVRAWATQGGAGHDSYPAAMPRRTCVDLFATLGCSLEASFLAPMGIASTEVLVFGKGA